MQKNLLFRKKAMDKIASPEQLNDYLRGTNISLWLILGAVIILLLGFGVWGVFGRLETRVNVIAISWNGEIEAFVNEKDISGISVGQKVYVDGEEHKVLSISNEVVSAEAHFSNDMVHLERLTEQDMFYVLDLSGSLPEGAYDAAIIKEEYPPLSLLFD